VGYAAAGAELTYYAAKTPLQGHPMFIGGYALGWAGVALHNLVVRPLMTRAADGDEDSRFGTERAQRTRRGGLTLATTLVAAGLVGYFGPTAVFGPKKKPMVPGAAQPATPSTATKKPASTTAPAARGRTGAAPSGASSRAKIRTTSAAQTSRTHQVVVTADSGVHERIGPTLGSPIRGTVLAGTLLQATGARVTDRSGQTFAEVSVGRSADGKPLHLWVAAQFLASHPVGAMNATGRFEPSLQKQGYEAVTVGPGDSLALIAARYDANLTEMIRLNEGHILNPRLIYPGDTVYLPKTNTAARPQVA
jgi:hypothetical protein